MKNISNIVYALFAILILLLAGNANAIPVTWTLSGVTFNDGNSAEGFFVYDRDTSILSSWKIDVDGFGGPFVFSAFSYNSSASGHTVSTTFPHAAFVFHDDIGILDFELSSVAFLSNAGGVVPIAIGPFSVERNNTFSAFRTIETGSLNGAPVPEPGTMFLLGSGMLGLGFFRKKFKK